MSYNICNSPYVKPLYTYTIHATQLQACKNNYYATQMQIVYNYHGNIMLTLLFINPSNFNTWHYGDF